MPTHSAGDCHAPVVGVAAPISVVIPSWNCLTDLQVCLESIAAQTVTAAPLVIDNGSSDGTLEFLQRVSIEHAALPENAGFSVAVNRGLAMTETPFVMVLNADASLEPDCLELLANALAADEGLGGVQPVVLDPGRGGRRGASSPGNVVYSAGQGLTRDGRAFEWGAGRRYGELHPVRRDVFGVCGATCLLRRRMLDEVGGYDESYFAFYEDVDLNVRGRIAGWHFEVDPQAFAWHVGQVTWRSGFTQPAEENARLVARNRLATQIKFMSPASIPRIVLIEAAAILRATSRGRLRSTVAGKLAALGWIPDLLRQRRRLRAAGDPKLARAWLGQNRGPRGGSS